MSRGGKLFPAMCLGLGVWHSYLVLMGVLQLTLISLVFPDGMVDEIAQSMRSRPGTPAAMIYLYSNYPTVTLAWMTLSLVTAVHAFAAWRFRGWSRWGLMACLAVQIMEYLAMPVLVVMYSVSYYVPAGAPMFFKLIMTGIVGFAALQPVVFALGHAWLLQMCTRPEVKAEFA